MGGSKSSIAVTALFHWVAQMQRKSSAKVCTEVETSMTPTKLYCGASVVMVRNLTRVVREWLRRRESSVIRMEGGRAFVPNFRRVPDGLQQYSNQMYTIINY